MGLFSCPKCEYATDRSINSLRIHYTKSKHGSAEELWQLLYNDGKPVTCKCGCGEPTKFLGVVKGYAEWKRGHVSRVRNNWGHNNAVLKKSQATRRQMHKDGKITVWNKGLTAASDTRVADYIQKMNTPERGHKISKALTGVSKSDEHKAKIQEHMQKYWADKNNRENQRQRRLKYMSKPGKWQCYGTCHRVMYEGRELFLKSNYEFQAFKYFQRVNNIASFEYESLPIRCNTGQIYLPDFVVTMTTGEKKIIEIKSEFYINDPSWQVKETSARQYADEHGYTFEVWTEQTHPFLSDKP